MLSLKYIGVRYVTINIHVILLYHSRSLNCLLSSVKLNSRQLIDSNLRWSDPWSFSTLPYELRWLQQENNPDCEWQIRQNVNTRSCGLLWGAFYYFAKGYRGKSRKKSPPAQTVVGLRFENRASVIQSENETRWSETSRISYISVPWLITIGMQNRPCVSGTLIYEEANLRKVVRLVCLIFSAWRDSNNRF